MPKEKPLPNSSEIQVLQMARQVLGRVKEMDLTPEENEKMNAMIDEAKLEETAGNKLKAFKIYQQLLNLLQKIKIENKNDFKVTPEMIKRQLAIVEMALTDVSEKKLIFGETNANLVFRFELLKRQKELIQNWKNIEPEILEAKKVNIESSKIFTEKEIRDLIAEIEDLNLEHFFVTNKLLDSEGNLISLKLIQVGFPGVDYEYHIKGNYGAAGSSSETMIYRLQFTETKPMTINPIAEFNDHGDGTGRWTEYIVSLEPIS